MQKEGREDQTYQKQKSVENIETDYSPIRNQTYADRQWKQKIIEAINSLAVFPSLQIQMAIQIWKIIFGTKIETNKH